MEFCYFLGDIFFMSTHLTSLQHHPFQAGLGEETVMCTVQNTGTREKHTFALMSESSVTRAISPRAGSVEPLGSLTAPRDQGVLPLSHQAGTDWISNKNKRGGSVWFVSVQRSHVGCLITTDPHNKVSPDAKGGRHRHSRISSYHTAGRPSAISQKGDQP